MVTRADPNRPLNSRGMVQPEAVDCKPYAPSASGPTALCQGLFDPRLLSTRVESLWKTPSCPHVGRCESAWRGIALFGKIEALG